ncbi:hypothetical protein [Actinokineospora terrae]|uniref:Uncharacterized protein n=1 Tax=Actinokineospora terrae TaxID=155974 RepID=A0A1H9T6M8_9PSEU|nr:hypothetical protein [Actinokineospora terrae]SER92821.1 hypothetical protein SAMN04487818_10696 [Actinokineospora terrae]
MSEPRAVPAGERLAVPVGVRAGGGEAVLVVRPSARIALLGLAFHGGMVSSVAACLAEHGQTVVLVENAVIGCELRIHAAGR